MFSGNLSDVSSDEGRDPRTAWPFVLCTEWCVDPWMKGKLITKVFFDMLHRYHSVDGYINVGDRF